MKIKITLVVALSMLSITSFAKIKAPSRGSSGFDFGKVGIAPALVLNRYFGELGANTYGLNLRFTYDESDENTFAFGYVYNLPNSLTTSVTGNALSSQTSPSYIVVPFTFSYTFHELYLQYFRYFVGDNEDDFSVYGFLGVSAVVAATTSTFGPHDGYQVGASSVDGTEYYTGYTVNAGIGTQFKVGPGYIFGEGRLAYPAGNSRDNLNPIPASVGLTAGYKFRFGR
jgi:hypothetical protein